MADSKPEVTNAQIFNEVAECTNALFKETAQLKKLGQESIDYLEPIHANVLYIHQMVHNLSEQVKLLRSELSSLRKELHK